MSRPWVKLHTEILDHFELDAVSPVAFKVYVKALALAGNVDEDGLLGPAAKVAYRLRMDEDTLRSVLTELDGRIAEVDGQLVVRDWLDHQSPSRTPEPAEQVAERKRRQRDRERQADVTQKSRMRETDRHAEAETASRNGHAPLELELEREKELHPPLSPPSAPPDSGPGSKPGVTLAGGKPPAPPVGTSRASPAGEADGAAPDRTWAPFEEAVSDALGGISVTHSRTGKPLAWVGELCKVAGKHSRHDVDAAIGLWEEYVRSEEWTYRKRDPKALAACFGAWLASRERPKEGRATEDPERRKEKTIGPERYAAMKAEIADLRARGLIDVLPRKPKKRLRP